MMMAEQVPQLGYTVVGPAFTISEARDLAVRASIDGALLDMNLDGILSHEIADILSDRQIPFAFITATMRRRPGFGPYTNIDVLHKPFQLIDLVGAPIYPTTRRALFGFGLLHLSYFGRRAC
jgi:hypothetical protein